MKEIDIIPKLETKFSRFLAFMLCWAILANLFVWLNPPAHQKPTEYFNVCIVENGKPKSITTEELPQNPKFCQQELRNVVGVNEMFYFHLDKVDNEWELTQYGDSMSDPWVFRYRIENHQIIPLWYHYGSGFVLHFTSWLSALFLTTIIHTITKRIIQRKKNHQIEK